MNSRRTRGIVLSISDHGEADKIVTFFSPDLGKVTGIAKGAKRSKQRFVNKLEEFSLLQVIYRPPRRDTLLFIVEADLENAFLSLRRDFRRYIMAMLAVELVLRFTREHDPDPAVFSLLLWAMSSLEKGENPLQVGALFHLRLLGAVGYQPELGRCGLCGKQVSAEAPFSLHQASGSLMCGACRKSSTDPLAPLSVQTLKFLDSAQRLDLKNMDRLRLPEKNSREALLFLYRYTQHLLQHDINSWQQVQTLL
ncbi:MAG: DNA repair protein RecO [Desulfobulbaceae bacterium]|nr:DNA repair protein RecO [Desulfobulbaceae bacterium]